MATLQQIIASIPTAQEGAVITIDYHNKVLAAIQLLAAQSGGGGGGPATVNLAFAPQLSAVDLLPWSLQTGIASKPGGTVTQATGWMGVQLPDGYLIDHMVVSGNRSTAAGVNFGSFTVTLIQEPLTSTGLIAVLSAALDSAPVDGSGNFSVTARASASTVVNNSQSKYILLARILGADAAATASIYGIQVVCTAVSSAAGGAGGLNLSTGFNLLG